MISVTMVKPSVWDNCRILSVDWAEEKIIFNEHIDLVDKNSHEKQLEEKQKIIDEQLEIIKFYADINNWSKGERFQRNVMIGDSDSLEYMSINAGKKAREYLQRMEGKK